ncbi:MAG: hypothetical protein ABSC19_07090 [Syntrophorhabdales bacterium]|jgi:chromosome segregation ATPase
MDHISEAREQLRSLERESAAAEMKLRSARESKEKAVADLADARGRLINAEKHVEETLFAIAGGTASPEDLRAGRAMVKSLKDEIEDFSAVIAAYAPVESSLTLSLNDLRQRVVLETKLYWARVAEGKEERVRKTVGSLVREAAAARELAGAYLFDGGGSYLSKIFFDNSAPRLDPEKAALLEKYLK